MIKARFPTSRTQRTQRKVQNTPRLFWH